MVAYAQTEADVKRKVETHWLQAGRVHDVIVIKIQQPIASATIPTVMTVSNDKGFWLLLNLALSK